jgi:membrane dipeptidase
MIASSLPILRTFFARGIRYMTLTHWKTTRWADAATDDPRHDGLTSFGRVGRARDEPAGDAGRPQPRGARRRWPAALEVAEARSSSRTRAPSRSTPHPRNVPDDILRRVPGNGGVVMAVFLSQFVSDEVRRHMQPGMDPGRRIRARAPGCEPRGGPRAAPQLDRREPPACGHGLAARRPHRPPGEAGGRRACRDRQRLRRRRAHAGRARGRLGLPEPDRGAAPARLHGR